MIKDDSEYFFKIVCVDLHEIEYCVLEDTNKSTLEEVHDFVKQNFHKHPHAMWKLYPFIKHKIK